MHTIFVHKYKYSHYSRRKQFKRWLKKGYVAIAMREQTGTRYTQVLNAPFKVVSQHSKRGRVYNIEPNTIK